LHSGITLLNQYIQKCKILANRDQSQSNIFKKILVYKVCRKKAVSALHNAQDFRYLQNKNPVLPIFKRKSDKQEYPELRSRSKV
jgi:hypothetical protein